LLPSAVAVPLRQRHPQDFRFAERGLIGSSQITILVATAASAVAVPLRQRHPQDFRFAERG